MLLECIPHFDELYIRSYPLGPASNPYQNKLIDLPVTLQVDEHSFYMTYRRDLARGWKVMCADGEMKALRSLLCDTLGCDRADPDLNEVVATIFEYVQESCKVAVAAVPQVPTRREVLEAIVKGRSAVALLKVNVGVTGRSLQFLYLGGREVVAVELDNGPPEALVDAVELDLDEWRALCDRIKACDSQPRQDIEAMIVQQFKQRVGGLGMAKPDGFESRQLEAQA